MSSQLFVTWFDVAGHQHLKNCFLAPWLLPWIYPWDLPCISYSLLVPWVLPCWHPWVLPCHLDTLGVQCTLNILVPLIYQQFRSDFIIAALTPLLSPTLPRCLLFCPPYNLQFAQISASHTKFCWPRSKIKGTILAIGHWPEMAKIRDEPRKIIPTSETENISQDKYLLYFYKLWVFIYFKWLSDRPQSASFWVQTTFLFYSTDKIPWNHHSPLISITGLKRESGFYFFENVICTNCECSSIWSDNLIDHNQPHSG